MFRSGSEYEWELFSSSAVGSYVAVAFSSDDKMGEDIVMACARVGPQ